MSGFNPTQPGSATGVANQRETAALIAADKVQGTSVYDTKGDMLGTIHSVMIDKRSGQVSYAVMSFGGFLGGFLGLGEKYHPLPWNRLRYDEKLAGYVIDIDPKVLEGAPAYNDEAVWNATSYSNDIDSYYAGTPSLV